MPEDVETVVQEEVEKEQVQSENTRFVIVALIKGQFYVFGLVLFLQDNSFTKFD